MVIDLLGPSLEDFGVSGVQLWVTRRTGRIGPKSGGWSARIDIDWESGWNRQNSGQTPLICGV